MKFYFLPHKSGMLLLAIKKQNSTFRMKTESEVITMPITTEDSIKMVGSYLGQEEETLLEKFLN
jgi:hypothetical protein